MAGPHQHHHVGAVVLAPGQQARLFPVPARPGPLTLAVVEPSGRRHPPTTTVAVAALQARAIATEAGTAWIVASDGTTVEITPGEDGSVVTADRDHGWPATVASCLNARRDHP